jgi:hypothetical protein
MRAAFGMVALQFITFKKYPCPEWSLGNDDEGSIICRIPRKYVRKTRKPASATDESAFHPTALTGLDRFTEIYPR